jgi:nucleoside-diphosphate-sugar epimerase
MKVLVTGSDGYLGAVLTPCLLDDGHDVKGVDTGYYASGLLYAQTGIVPATARRDIRLLQLEDIAGFDAIVHMAELSNDPTGELSPRITYDINHKATVRLAGLAKRAGVSRFVYMSSCSVYGAGDGDRPVDERSSIRPQTAYAICKSLCERDLAALADDDFSPVFLRNATAFGASPRQRFDLVVNDLAGLAWTTREIRMLSDGTPWRPLVHARDIAEAIRCVLQAPRASLHNEVLNVGSNEQNYRVREIADMIGSVFPDCRITLGDQGADKRSYRVCFDRIAQMLPDFTCRWDVARGARQLRHLFERLDLSPETFQARPFTRLKQLTYLHRTHQIDDDFYWTPDQLGDVP